MKRIALLFALLCSLGIKAQSTEQFFQLPIIPDSLNTLQQRTDFMLQHYWDFCDLKKSFSARDKMADAFNTYLSFMPYASADVVFESVDNFMNKIAKQPDDVLFIAEQAENALYAEDAEMPSDELYLRFLKAIIANKKIDKNAKLRYQYQAGILSKSQTGMPAPQFEYTDAFGDKHTFIVDSTKIATILFFNHPDCSDCLLARVRLDADIKTTKLIESGKVCIMNITPGDDTPEWRIQASGYPSAWTNGISAQVEEIYDLRLSPAFYVIDQKGIILLKTGQVDAIINIMALLNAPRRRSAQSSETESQITASE